MLDSPDAGNGALTGLTPPDPDLLEGQDGQPHGGVDGVFDRLAHVVSTSWPAGITAAPAHRTAFC
jgi:hypothetical protein